MVIEYIFGHLNPNAIAVETSLRHIITSCCVQMLDLFGKSRQSSCRDLILLLVNCVTSGPTVLVQSIGHRPSDVWYRVMILYPSLNWWRWSFVDDDFPAEIFKSNMIDAVTSLCIMSLIDKNWKYCQSVTKNNIEVDDEFHLFGQVWRN